MLPFLAGSGSRWSRPCIALLKEGPKHPSLHFKKIDRSGLLAAAFIIGRSCSKIQRQPMARLILQPIPIEQPRLAGRIPNLRKPLEKTNPIQGVRLVISAISLKAQEIFRSGIYPKRTSHLGRLAMLAKRLPLLAGASLLCAFTQSRRSSSRNSGPAHLFKYRRKIFLYQINHLRSFSTFTRTLIRHPRAGRRFPNEKAVTQAQSPKSQSETNPSALSKRSAP
jgi:hypothetical protein